MELKKITKKGKVVSTVVPPTTGFTCDHIVQMIKKIISICNVKSVTITTRTTHKSERKCL